MLCFHLQSAFTRISKKGNAKECLSYYTVGRISHASKVMLKILQARLQYYVNQELPDLQAVFRKGRGSRDQIANIQWTMGKRRGFQKSIYFCFIDYTKAFVWITTSYAKEMGIPDHLVSWETCIQVMKQQLELDMEKRTGSKLGKQYFKAVYCHPAYLTYMLHEICWARWSTSWNQDCWEK